MTVDRENPTLTAVLERLERVLAHAERLLAERAPASVDDDVLEQSVAFIWQRRGPVGTFRPVKHFDAIRLEDLSASTAS